MNIASLQSSAAKKSIDYLIQHISQSFTPLPNNSPAQMHCSAFSQMSGIILKNPKERLK